MKDVDQRILLFMQKIKSATNKVIMGSTGFRKSTVSVATKSLAKQGFLTRKKGDLSFIYTITELGKAQKVEDFFLY